MWYLSFCPKAFGNVRKQLDQKTKVNFRIYDVINWKQNYKRRIGHISRSKGSQAMTFHIVNQIVLLHLQALIGLHLFSSYYTSQMWCNMPWKTLFGQLIEFNVRNIYFFKNDAEHETEKLVIVLFLIFKEPFYEV